MNNYVIKNGFWSKFKPGRKFKGLHLNRVIRDVLRQCGIPCPNCLDGDCNEVIAKLFTGIPIPYTNAAGDKREAMTLSLPTYADDTAAGLDGFPVNGLYYNSTTGAITKKLV